MERYEFVKLTDIEVFNCINRLEKINKQKQDLIEWLEKQVKDSKEHAER